MQITQNLHQLTIPFSVPLPNGAVRRTVNLFVLAGQELTLIDSGVAGAEAVLYTYLQQLGRRPEEMSTLVLTHSHPDHIGAARTIQARSNCRIYAHAAEQDWIEDVALQCQQRPVPGFAGLVAGSVKVDQCLQDGELLDFAGACALRVLHTPGHSAGSLSLWDQEHGILLCGDAVLQPGDLPIADDLAAAQRSLQRLRECGADCLLQAWDRPRTGQEVAACLQASFDWLEQIKGVVAETVDQHGPLEPLALCGLVVPQLGLPQQAINPLVARTFAAYAAQL